MANFKYRFSKDWEAEFGRELRESENEKARELLERQPFDHEPVQQRALLRLAMRGKDRSGTIRNVPTTIEQETERQA